MVWFQVETQPFVVLLGITSEIPDFMTPCDKGATEIALKQCQNQVHLKFTSNVCTHTFPTFVTRKPEFPSTFYREGASSAKKLIDGNF